MDIRSADWDDLNESQKVQKHYLIALESVDLINRVIAGEKTWESPKKVVERNVEHLKIMLGKSFWEAQDLNPIEDAVIAGENYVAN